MGRKVQKGKKVLPGKKSTYCKERKILLLGKKYLALEKKKEKSNGYRGKKRMTENKKMKRKRKEKKQIETPSWKKKERKYNTLEEIAVYKENVKERGRGKRSKEKNIYNT